jgi:hypothetical protein
LLWQLFVLVVARSRHTALDKSLGGKMAREVKIYTTTGCPPSSPLPPEAKPIGDIAEENSKAVKMVAGSPVRCGQDMQLARS